MRSLNRVGSHPASLPLSAEDVVEFHAARLLLLLNVCGVRGRIDGLTKVAKLDFFTRYPDFFEAARTTLVPTKAADTPDPPESSEAIESAMVRHHYGPWDKRYYHVFAYLEAKELITIAKEGRTYRIALTDLGRDRAIALAGRQSFAPIVERLREVKRTFGSKSGTFLKDQIYRLFDAEVRGRPLGEVIRR
jgi:hypothetical protein